MAAELDTTIDEWFAQSDINVYTGLSKSQLRKAKRMLCTWRDVFEDDMLKIRKTDLIEHYIPLLHSARPFKAKLPLYTDEERAFCNNAIPEMEKAGRIYRCDGEWGARTKFTIRNNPAEVLGVDRKAVEEHVLQRDDRGVLVGMKRAREQARTEEMRKATTSGRRRPKPGDLVLLRDL